MSQIAGKTESNEQTGWWRVDVWEGDDGGMFGDNEEHRCQVGTAYSVEYTDGAYKARLYYAVYHVKAFNQPDEPWLYTVDGVCEWWKVKPDANGDDQGADYAEIDYDHGSALYYATEELAQSEARRFAMTDESFAFNSPKEETA